MRNNTLHRTGIPEAIDKYSESLDRLRCSFGCGCPIDDVVASMHRANMAFLELQEAQRSQSTRFTGTSL